jgi:hypothetical protein
MSAARHGNPAQLISDLMPYSSDAAQILGIVRDAAAFEALRLTHG